MKRYFITYEALSAVRGQVRDGESFRDTSRAVGPGLYSVALSDDTIERLESLRFKGESLSDVIIRVCAGRRHH